MGNGLGDHERRVAIVTGGARGIGFGICDVLASDGLAVVVADINYEAAQTAAADLERRGLVAVPADHDVTSPASSAELARSVVSRFGRVDVLVNNAGISTRSAMVDMTLDQWQQMINVNLTSVFLVSHAIAPHMIERRQGRIINVASVLGKIGQPLMTHYTAAKFGVVGFTKALALELACHGITVNAVCPGLVRTSLMEAELQETAEREGITVDEVWAAELRGIPLQREQKPSDIGRAVAFLASNDNITGQAVNVDGGFVMH
jgi:meso-butanediol dehydrogenase / (S,S)-butanediol dehydrogenase / diacetyl reductase